MKNANQTGYGPLESGALEATSSGSASAVSSDAAESKAAASEQHLQNVFEVSSYLHHIPKKVVILSDPDFEPKDGDMRFRLTYEGPLYATQGESRDKQPVKHADHKHMLRKHFHKQLRQLWRTDYLLKVAKKNDVPLAEELARNYPLNNFNFVPLVRQSESLMCSLDILFLRRDMPGSVIQAGDIDNRLKTLIDGLRRPTTLNELGKYTEPDEGEKPFYCLLENDDLINHFSVEGDRLLDEQTDDDTDKRLVRLVITVVVRPYDLTLENIDYITH